MKEADVPEWLEKVKVSCRRRRRERMSRRMLGPDVGPPLQHLSPSHDVTATPPGTVLNVLKRAAQGFGWLFHSFVFTSFFVSDGSVSQ